MSAYGSSIAIPVVFKTGEPPYLNPSAVLAEQVEAAIQLVLSINASPDKRYFIMAKSVQEPLPESELKILADKYRVTTITMVLSKANGKYFVKVGLEVAKQEGQQ